MKLHPGSLGWWLAATVGPERLALGLTILVAILIVVVVRLGSP